MSSRTPARAHSTDRQTNQLQTNIAAALKVPLSQPQAYGQILAGVKLASGTNTVPHGLGRNLIGWQIVRLRASASIYDTQDANPTPASTLQLSATFAVTVDIFVF